MVYGINNIPNFFWYFKRNIKYGDINNVIIKDRKDNFSSLYTISYRSKHFLKKEKF